MFSSLARRSLLTKVDLKAAISTAKQVRLQSSTTALTAAKATSAVAQTPGTVIENRSLHSTPARYADATTKDEPAAEESKTTSLAERFTTTFEVTVSKIFPAGFGWQTASIIAENNFGYAPDTLAFALTTGVGDAIFVCAGHVGYYGIKKTVYDGEINMSKEVQTGILLGSAAMCSGTAWQPLVDVLQGANLSFFSVFAGAWVGCGTAFYLGLRGTRTILSGYMEHIEGPTFENNMNDKSLSAAIGGASAFFVGTDAAYLPSQNFLIDVVGIKDGTPDLLGCGIAGSSTAMGFAVAQSTFNMIYPAGKLWND